jgi:hypothetical protein
MATTVTRRDLLTATVATLVGIVGWTGRASAQAKPHLTVYKDPNCGCCGEWVSYMNAKGYKSTVLHVDLGPIKQQYNVGPNLQSCHTTLVDGMVIEGHVPEADIVRLLKERPAGIIGLTIPGMPASAPGMDLTPFQPFSTLAFDKTGKTTVWQRHTKPA